MKIIIHGSVFTDNFGDVLFSDMFYSRLKKNGNEVYFLGIPKIGISDFAKKEINYKEKCTLRNLLTAKVVVMLSGGYLGEDAISFKNTIVRYIKYILPIRVFELLKKKVYIIAVGGGPLNNSFLRYSCVKALNKATYLSVRDEETYQYFKGYGVKNNMIITSDTAQSITKAYCNGFKMNYCVNNGSKYIFLHYVNNQSVDEEMAEKVIPALNRFLMEHNDYGVIVGTDVKVEYSDVLNSKTYSHLNSNDKTIFEYNSVKELCGLLSSIDFVVTPKLHVGIVAASFGKSVISFPIHREKTGRYYRQIGEEQRSIKLSEVNENIVYSQLSCYYDKPIIIPDSLIRQANANIELLDSIIEE